VTEQDADLLAAQLAARAVQPFSVSDTERSPGPTPDRRDDDLLGLGESKRNEDALRAKWSGGRDTAASRASGARGPEELRIVLRMTALGFQFIGEIAAAVLIGYGIDWWRGTFPFWTSVFSIGGIVIALISLVRNALRMNKLLERESKPRSSPP